MSLDGKGIGGRCFGQARKQIRGKTGESSELRVQISVFPPRHLPADAVPGIRGHHVPLPLGKDVMAHESVPCASPSRIIVDLACMVGDASLRPTIEQAAVLQMLDVRRSTGSSPVHVAVAARGWRHPRRVASLSKCPTSQSDGGEVVVTSLAEDLPIPSCNERLRIGERTYEIDFLWHRQHLIVETDGEGSTSIPLPRRVTLSGTGLSSTEDSASFACDGGAAGPARGHCHEDPAPPRHPPLRCSLAGCDGGNARLCGAVFSAVPSRWRSRKRNSGAGARTGQRPRPSPLATVQASSAPMKGARVT